MSKRRKCTEDFKREAVRLVDASLLYSLKISQGNGIIANVIKE